MAAPTAVASGSSLKTGDIVGARFVVERPAGHDALGVVLLAKDQKTNKAIALRVLAPQLVARAAAQDVLRTEVKGAASLAHRSILATYGVGNEPGGTFYVACEWIDGAPLSTVVARRRQEGRGPLSLRGAYNVIAHVCKALSAAHPKTCHGALRPSVVWVSRSGRVKVGDFGVARAVLKASGAQALGADEQGFLAPEVKSGGQPTVRSDIFGVGALLYVMLTGRSPSEEFVAPSQAHPDATPDIDTVLMRCLTANPASRFASADEVRTALLPLVAGAPDASADDFGVDVDVDVDLASQAPAARRAAAPAAAHARGEQGAPRVGSRVSIHEQFRPSAVGPGPAPLDPTAGGAPSDGGSSRSEVDLAALLAKITENDAPRWMVVKDKLDHGPFSGRELVQLILKGEVLEDHGLLNMDTGERRKVKGFPEFVEFLEQFKIRKREAEHKVALARSAKVEKVAGAGKFLILSGVFGALVLGGLAFYFTLKGRAREHVTDAELADLYERGQIEITGTAGILPDPPRGRGGGGHRRGGGGGGGGGGMSYDEAMNEAVNLGDVAHGGGEARLSPQDIAGVMNRNLNSMYRCVGAELRHGGDLHNVQIDLAIAGSGQVQGASVSAGSPSFKSCVAGRVRRIRFPTFSAPRMGARYSFSVD